MNNIRLTTVVRTPDLLAKLRDNRSKHAGIVREARAGYMEQAKEALEGRLKQLTDGQLQHLRFSLEPPRDHTDCYDTVISMMAMHVHDTVELEADEFRQLVLDQWDWTREFYASNKRFSGTAQREADVHGY